MTLYLLNKITKEVQTLTIDLFGEALYNYIVSPVHSFQEGGWIMLYFGNSLKSTG